MSQNNSPLINKNNSHANFGDGIVDLGFISSSPTTNFSQKKSISRRSYR